MGRSRRTRPRITRRAGAALASGVVSLATAGAIVASAAVPTFPDNVVVFPERDFVVIEGYQNHLGELATVEVTRGGTVMGSAQAVVQEGDVAFEINHPGGACWGAGTNLKVTPDIKPGDKVTIKFGGVGAGDTTVADTSVGPEHAKLESDGRTVTVKGHIAAGVDPANIEQRIVNPDLKDLIGRRDVRAAVGDIVASDNGGYSSGVEVNGTDFTSTFVFDDPAAARIAAGTGVERVLAWQVADADANRQGLTISEFGEAGGPGFGGCPAGPGQQDAPQGTYASVRSTDKTQLAINWTPATPAPGAAAVTGYDVTAIVPAANGEPQKTVGMRVGASGKNVTLPVDSAVAEYTVEVRSLTGAKMSEPFTKADTQPAGDPGDTIDPKLTFAPAPNADGSVTEATEVRLSTDSGSAIYYTVDGSPVIVDGDSPSDSALLYDPQKPIAITQETEVKAAALDRANNFVTDVAKFAPPAAQQPTAMLKPTGLAGTAAITPAGVGSVALSWSPVENATSYQVKVYNADGTTLLPALTQPGETTQTTQSIGGLAGSTAYQFSVTGINAGGSSEESDKIRVLTKESLTAAARWKTGDFRVTGTSSATSGSVQVLRAVRNTTTGVLEPGLQFTGGSGPLATAAPPAQGTTYSVRMRTGVPTTNPGTIFVRSNTGTLIQVTVTNG